VSDPLQRVPEKPRLQRLEALRAQIDGRLRKLGVEAKKTLPGGTVGLSSRPRLSVATMGRRAVRWESGVSAARDLLCPLPGRKGTLHVLMDGSFTGWQVAEALLTLTGPWRRLYVATMSFNLENSTALLAALDGGRIRKLLFACSEYFRETDAATFESLRRQLRDRGQRIFCARVHAKIIAAQDHRGRCWVVESSANLRSCNAIEQFGLCQSKTVFRFHADWLETAYEKTESQNRP
jgi:hypothetical protein